MICSVIRLVFYIAERMICTDHYVVSNRLMDEIEYHRIDLLILLMFPR